MDMGERPKRHSFRYQIYHLFWAGVDALFPPACAGCGEQGVRWCTACHAAVEHPKLICQCCGQVSKDGNLCVTCSRALPAFAQARTWGIHQTSLRNAILRLKYSHDLGLAEAFAKALYPVVYDMDWQIDLVVPVPLATRRLRERGYNQAALIAAPLAWQSNIQYKPDALQRIRETRTQIGLSATERRENVANAFLANESIVLGMRILLVDDVMTSGATMQAASEALLVAGSQAVYAVTVSRPKID